MNLEYSKDDLKGCVLDTIDLPLDVDIMGTIPMLKRLSGFGYNFEEFPNPKVYRNMTIRYMNYFYSKGTKLDSDYPDPKKRKAVCAALAGFQYDPITGKFNDLVSDMLRGKNAMVNRMIISFTAHHYSTEFSTLCSMRDMFYSMMEDQTDPTKVKSIFAIQQDLVKLERDMLNNDDSKIISMALVQRMEEIKLELKPEDVARRISEGKSPIDFDVYG